MSESRPIAPRRRSASAEAALRVEMARIDAMTMEERVKAALSLPERFAWLAPAHPPQGPIPDATGLNPGSPGGFHPPDVSVSRR